MVGGREGAIAITKKEPIHVIVSSQQHVQGAIPVNIAHLQTPQKRYALARHSALETFRRRD